jgi:thiamine-phosphate pyrophosphorylase
MRLKSQEKLIYLITSGHTHPHTTPASKEFLDILRLIEVAVTTGINLVQIREKLLSARTLFELTASAARITHRSLTQLLVNDRADIAVGAGADGVHLAANSISPDVIRATFGNDLLIGASTHSIEQVYSAESKGADFVVLGPIFETASKVGYGAPLGLETLQSAAQTFPKLPILAIGGITLSRAADCVRSGADGVAAISLLNNLQQLPKIVTELRNSFE